jgi:hypothetical protein
MRRTRVLHPSVNTLQPRLHPQPATSTSVTLPYFWSRTFAEESCWNNQRLLSFLEEMVENKERVDILILMSCSLLVVCFVFEPMAEKNGIGAITVVCMSNCRSVSLRTCLVGFVLSFLGTSIISCLRLVVPYLHQLLNFTCLKVLHCTQCYSTISFRPHMRRGCRPVT